MSINRIRGFVAVAESGSLRAAADVLGCSTPALSRSIRALEREMGIQLLQPAGRGIRVTPAGERFATRAQRVLEQYRELHEIAADETDRSELRIASFEVFTTYALGWLAAGALAGHRLSVVAVTPGRVEAAVAGGLADVGLTYAATAAPDIEHVSLGSSRMVVAHHRSLPLGSGPPFQAPFAVPARLTAGVLSDNLNADGWPAGIEREVAYRVNAMESALELARQGLAATFVPAFVVSLHNRQVRDEYQLETTPLETAQPQPLFAVVPARFAQEALVHRLVSALGRLLDEHA